MSFADKKGITVASGFKLQAQSPIDARFSVDTIAERDELVTIKAAYPGLQVYVAAEKKTYRYDGSAWAEMTAGAAYTHPTTPGYKHVPAGGAAGQVLRWKANGEAEWGAVEIGDIGNVGAAGGLASLGEDGKVPSAQLPSYVDDVVDVYVSGGKMYSDSAHTNEVAGETGKIYIDLTTLKTYRWSGSALAEISASLALGETSATAYRGDRGKIAYEHSQAAHAPANAQKNVQADWNVTDTGADAFIKNKPTALPANGGNADTVGGHTVEANVPAGAKFTDTTYSKATQSTDGLMSAADKKKLDNQPQIYFESELPASAPTGSICFLIG